jgi:CHAT domain-containing protein
MFFDAGRPGASLADWMLLPISGVEQAVFPGFHTSSENALKRASTGDEVFLTATSLMATGCRTALLSRWRVGGQSTADLVREFVQELPHQPASAAWRRSVQLASERLLDPALEPRVRPGASDGVPGGHPFFWSGYMLLDTGATPIEASEHH